jgi:hypothetical protein
MTEAKKSKSHLDVQNLGLMAQKIEAKDLQQ